MSTTKTEDRIGIRNIDKTWESFGRGWNAQICWLIQTTKRVPIKVGTTTVRTDYFVLSSVVLPDLGEKETVVIAVNDLYQPLKHYGVVGGIGWSTKRAKRNFEQWLELPSEMREEQQIASPSLRKRAYVDSQENEITED